MLFRSKSGLLTAFARSGEQSFEGFVVDLDDQTRKFSVEILVDGHPIRVILANAYVHKLAREGSGTAGSVSFFLSKAMFLVIIRSSRQGWRTLAAALDYPLSLPQTRVRRSILMVPVWFAG